MRSGLAEAAPASNTSGARAPVGGSVKRAFDIVMSAAALVALAPLFVFVALFVKLSSPGPVFYAHKRVGHGGRSFGCIKFRTMVTDGDRVLQQHLAANPDARIEWEQTRKLKRDPRVTALGAALRSSSLDEIPQFLNVLKGEMSLVGPRPVVTDELSLYGPQAAYYLAARPGITGQWQVSGRNDVSYEARIRFDRTYVERWSLGSDIWILTKTVPAVIAARGVY